jgi:hypothetical protein
VRDEIEVSWQRLEVVEPKRGVGEDFFFFYSTRTYLELTRRCGQLIVQVANTKFCATCVRGVPIAHLALSRTILGHTALCAALGRVASASGSIAKVLEADLGMCNVELEKVDLILYRQDRVRRNVCQKEATESYSYRCLRRPFRAACVHVAWVPQ